MSTLKTHNLQSPDASSVNIAMSPNAGMVVTGIATFNSAVSVGNSVTATAFYGDGTNLTGVDAATLKFGGATKAQANAAGVIITGILTATNVSVAQSVTATTYYGSGANLTNLPPSAPVGGASTNQVFFENDKAVEVNYQITSTKNAMSAGPISINAGIAVTVPSGCSWTIV